jgi:signal peptidase I
MWDKAGVEKLWHFFWHEDTIWSWLANVVVAFLVIRFIIYPLLGVILGTSFPIVAVVSESMEHGLSNQIICGQRLDEFQESFDNYWTVCGDWYEKKGITKKQFAQFPFKNGFDKGDVIILWRANKKNIKVGDVLVFQGNKPQPIIHRVVNINDEFYQTKGDHNKDSIEGEFGETKIKEERIFGKGILRIPYFGWVKIAFVDAVRPLGITIER